MRCCFGAFRKYRLGMFMYSLACSMFFHFAVYRYPNEALCETAVEDFPEGHHVCIGRHTGTRLVKRRPLPGRLTTVSEVHER